MPELNRPTTAATITIASRPQAATNTDATHDWCPRQIATGPYARAATTRTSQKRAPRLRASTMMINTPRTRRIFTGSDAARTAWRTRASPSWAIRLPGRDRSSDRILLPRAVPCIAHYHALTATHNQIPVGNGQARSCRAGASRSPTGPALWPGTDPARVMASSRRMPLRHSHKGQGNALDLVVHSAENLLSKASMSAAGPAGLAPASRTAGPTAHECRPATPDQASSWSTNEYGGHGPFRSARTPALAPASACAAATNSLARSPRSR